MVISKKNKGGLNSKGPHLLMAHTPPSYIREESSLFVAKLAQKEKVRCKETAPTTKYKVN